MTVLLHACAVAAFVTSFAVALVSGNDAMRVASLVGIYVAAIEANRVVRRHG